METSKGSIPGGQPWVQCDVIIERKACVKWKAF